MSFGVVPDSVLIISIVINIDKPLTNLRLFVTLPSYEKNAYIMFRPWPAADCPGYVGLTATRDYFRPVVSLWRIACDNIERNGGFNSGGRRCLHTIRPGGNRRDW